MNFSSAFNPDLLFEKLKATTFLFPSSALVPHKDVFSLLLYFLTTNDYMSRNHSVKLLKFANDTTLTGQKNGNEFNYRE